MVSGSDRDERTWVEAVPGLVAKGGAQAVMVLALLAAGCANTDFEEGADSGAGPVIMSGHCTNCGRCIDVCGRDVFEFSTRFSNPRPAVSGVNQQSEVSS